MADSILNNRITNLPLKTRSLYSFCTNIKKSGNYSETISDITYDIEAVITDTVDDTNISTIFNNVSNDESKFLLLKAKNINISGTLTPPYPKKSLIIFCPNIEGTGTISMTGKGPNCLPEDILLFETNEVPETGRVLIPAYANNAKTCSGQTGNTNTPANFYYNKKGNNGTGYNCGSGGIGGVRTSNMTVDRSNITFISGSGYSYGGGAGTGGQADYGTTYTSAVNSTYPMRGGNGSGGYASTGGVGNPQGADQNASSMNRPAAVNAGVGGRLMIFCKSISDLNLKSEGGYYPEQSSSSNNVLGSGGSSGGGSINIFYSASVLNIATSVVSYPSIRHTQYNEAHNNCMSGSAGGDGTVVSIQCSNIKYK